MNRHKISVTWNKFWTPALQWHCIVIKVAKPLCAYTLCLQKQFLFPGSGGEHFVLLYSFLCIVFSCCAFSVISTFPVSNSLIPGTWVLYLSLFFLQVFPFCLMDTCDFLVFCSTIFPHCQSTSIDMVVTNRGSIVVKWHSLSTCIEPN